MLVSVFAGRAKIVCQLGRKVVLWKVKGFSHSSRGLSGYAHGGY